MKLIYSLSDLRNLWLSLDQGPCGGPEFGSLFQEARDEGVVAVSDGPVDGPDPVLVGRLNPWRHRSGIGSTMAQQNIQGVDIAWEKEKVSISETIASNFDNCVKDCEV